MDRSVHRARARLRIPLVGLVAVALTALLPAAPAFAEAPAVTGLAAQVVDRAARVSWTAAGTGTSVACVIPAPAETVAQSDCVRTLPVTGLQARDTGFTNTASVTYAVWAVDTDGTTSAQPAVVTLAPAPAVATAITLSPAALTVPYGRIVTLTAVLTRNGARVPQQGVQLWGGVVGSGSSSLIRTLTTGTDGIARFAVMPKRSMRYAFRFTGNAFSLSSTSAPSTVTILPRVSLALTPSVLRTGETSYASGQVQPPLPYAAYVVQRRVDGVWRGLLLGRTTSTGAYRIPVKLGSGSHPLRVVTAAQVGLRQAVSPAVSLTVYPRDLYDGMAGADVLQLQRWLVAHHYDPGPLTGSYSYDTHHAVMAFQKVERLPATGRWGRSERARSSRPTAWRVRYPSAGRAVDVDITRQVLVLSEGGRVMRIIDISTGNEQRYTVDGVTSVAHTPRGQFSIYNKINGMRISRLGQLWKPSYFFRGYAIHGSPSVPAYPASHGCVRITNSNANRIFPLLTYGTKVTVFDE